MFPSFTIWNGWHNSGTDSHTYNNRGNVSWASGLAYRDHLDNSTETTVTRTYLLPAGLYTMALGSNAPATNTNRQGFKCSLTTATQLPVDLQSGGIGYAHTLVTDGTDSGSFSNHVGAWSWEDNALFGNPGQGTQPVGWTHTSRWVALRLTRSAFFTLTLERDATVPWPSAENSGRLADTSSMFPSFTIWNGWHNSGTDSHTYNNRGNVSWASGLAYRDHLDNSTETTVTRTYLLPAGDYTLALGSNAPANNTNRQGFKMTFATMRTGIDPVPNTYPEDAPATGGVGYARTVIAGNGDYGSFSEHVGAWSWEDNALFGNPGQGMQPVGWTHTSKWVAVRLEETTFFTVTMARDANVPWPSGSDPNRKADISSMFPSLTLWRGWQNTGSDNHTYNNRGRVPWAPALFYLDHIDNSTETAVTRTWRLPAGDYTMALGSNAPATNPNRQGFKLTYDVRRALPGDTHGDPVANTYPDDGPATGGIGYNMVYVGQPGGGERSFSDHVGAWSWEDNALFDASAGDPPVGWTHTSRWVAIYIPVAMTLDLTIERDATVPWPSGSDPNRLADTSSMFPSFTLWRGWDNDGSDDHTYNNRGNVGWAEDLSYLDHLDNNTAAAVTRSWTLEPGFYTLVIGSNAPATNTNRQGFKAIFQGRAPVVGSSPRITAQPIGSTVVEGRPIRLGVSAAGAELQYQWFKDDVILRAETARTLSVPASSPSDAGRYHVRVRNPIGYVDSVQATVRVISLPEIEPGFDLPAGMIGQPYRVEVPVMMRPATLRVEGRLPPGLSVQATTGVISGIPTVPGVFPLRLSLSNAAGTSEVLAESLAIDALPSGMAGRFTGLLNRSAGLNENLGGQIDLTITPLGVFSGQVQLGAERHRVAGRFSYSLSGFEAQVQIPRSGRQPLLLSLYYDAARRAVDGMVSDRLHELPFSLLSRVLLTAPYRGAYTFALQTQRGDLDESVSLPEGQGFGSFSVSAAGNATVTIKLADGYSITHSAQVEQDGGFGILQVLFTQVGVIPRQGRELPRQRMERSGSFMARFFIHQALEGRLEDSSADWYRLPRIPRALDTSYPIGFGPLSLRVVGGPRPSLTAQDRIEVSFDHAQLEFSENHPSAEGRLTSVGVGVLTRNPCRVTFVLSRSTGLYEGGFQVRAASDSRATRAAKYHGILVHDGTAVKGLGFFLMNTFPGELPISVISGDASVTFSNND
jgi:hypothetical protein